MKTRKRRKKVEEKKRDRKGEVWIGNFPGSQGATVSFRDVDTAELVVIEDLEANVNVKDRFVKVAPRILASQREAFDGAKVAKSYRDAGARAVILAPVTVPEVQPSETEKVARSETPREAVTAWLEEQNVSAKEALAVVDLVFGFMDQENM